MIKHYPFQSDCIEPAELIPIFKVVSNEELFFRPVMDGKY